MLLIGGFSKTLAGSLRVGYVAAQPERIRALTDAKLLSGLTSPELGERVVHRILADGQYRKHVQRLRERVDTARQRCLKLVENMGLVVHQEPLAGMFIWADAGRDTEVLARQMAAQGVLLAPGCCFLPINRGQPCCGCRCRSLIQTFLYFSMSQECGFFRLSERHYSR